MRDLQVFRLEREVRLDHFQCRMTKDVLQIEDIAMDLSPVLTQIVSRNSSGNFRRGNELQI
jgi:hypothetical protein